MVGLYVQKGEQVGVYHNLDDACDSYMIGRNSDCGIQFSDVGISREHLLIVNEDGKWVLHDQGSRNGVYLNSTLITEDKEIVPQDVITLGTVELLVIDRDMSKEQTLSVDIGDDATLAVPALQSIIGESKAIQDVRAFIEKVSSLDTAILIQGETGTGKELVARAVHGASKRHKHPFVTVNCGVIADENIERAFFGCVEDDGSGIDIVRQGYFEQAVGGTLFLDEVAGLSQIGQVALLQVLENKTFRRVGSAQELRANVRVIATSQQDLSDDSGDIPFRKDLYYRLKVAEVTVPPLRERLTDIKSLVDYFMGPICFDLGKPDLKIGKKTFLMLETYVWVGNVRELKNLLRQAAINTKGTVVEPSNLPALDTSFNAEQLPFRSLKDLEESHVKRALLECNGNKSKAAKMLGVSRSALYEKLSKLDLSGD